jgi:hypothetical protein
MKGQTEWLIRGLIGVLLSLLAYVHQTDVALMQEAIEANRKQWGQIRELREADESMRTRLAVLESESESRRNR